MAYAARLQNQQSRELARIYAEEYDAEAARVSLKFNYLENNIRRFPYHVIFYLFPIWH